MEGLNPYESPREVNAAAPPALEEARSQFGGFTSAQKKAIAGGLPLLAVSLFSLLILTIAMYLALRKNTYDPDGSPPLILVRLVMQLVVAYGMVQMLRLRSYGAAMIAGLLGLLPCCSLFWFLEIPCGLVALFVLRLRDVQQAFD